MTGEAKPNESPHQNDKQPPAKRSNSDKQADLDLARQFLSFNDESKSPYHAVRALSNILLTAGFTPLNETDAWPSLEPAADTPPRRHFTIRNGTSLIAFVHPAVPAAPPAPLPFTILACHTDSPCLKIKPISSVHAHGYLQLGIECYGGGLWHTWFDRDLTVAGRVITRSDKGGTTTRLVSLPNPIATIPNLAIHLSRHVATEGFKVNKEADTTPILATLAATLNLPHTAGTPLSDRHPPLLLQALADHLDIPVAAILDVDLCLADTQPAAIGGLLGEFVHAPRLDNLASCFTAVTALVRSADTPSSHPSVRVLACFDHEEVGSKSAMGADSTFLPDVLARLASLAQVPLERALPRSLLVSADMAHAVHPNYAAKHEGRHRPALGSGLVIKTNQNQRYATSGISGFVVREAARRANAPVQEFVVPNDSPCGSTVGPLLASRSGILTVDVGQPQLAMHSIREMCSVHDFRKVVDVFVALFCDHVEILDSMVDA